MTLSLMLALPPIRKEIKAAAPADLILMQRTRKRRRKTMQIRKKTAAPATLDQILRKTSKRWRRKQRRRHQKRKVVPAVRVGPRSGVKEKRVDRARKVAPGSVVAPGRNVVQGSGVDPARNGVVPERRALPGNVVANAADPGSVVAPGSAAVLASATDPKTVVKNVLQTLKSLCGAAHEVNEVVHVNVAPLGDEVAAEMLPSKYATISNVVIAHEAIVADSSMRAQVERVLPLLASSMALRMPRSVPWRLLRSLLLPVVMLAVHCLLQCLPLEGSQEIGHARSAPLTYLLPNPLVSGVARIKTGHPVAKAHSVATGIAQVAAICSLRGTLNVEGAAIQTLLVEARAQERNQVLGIGLVRLAE